MTAKKQLWPEVAKVLGEFNDLATTALAIGPQSSPGTAKPFAWPSWAPAPGSWVRQAYQRRNVRRLRSPIWHIAGAVMFESEHNIYSLKPLCGREIQIQTDASPSGLTCATFDLRGAKSPDDRECWHCLRKIGIIGEFGAGQLRRPWGDLGARPFYARVRHPA